MHAGGAPFHQGIPVYMARWFYVTQYTCNGLHIMVLLSDYTLHSAVETMEFPSASFTA